MTVEHKLREKQKIHAAQTNVLRSVLGSQDEWRYKKNLETKNIIRNRKTERKMETRKKSKNENFRYLIGAFSFKLRVFENRNLRRIFGHKKNENGMWRSCNS